jgi:hypothetical protein
MDVAAVPTVQANSVAKVLHYARSLGADSAALLSAVGWSPRDLEPADRRVSFRTFVALYEEAAKRTGDAHFGLHVGASTDPRMFDVLGYAALCQETLGEAFEVVTRYLRVLQEGARIDVSRRDGQARISYAIEAAVGPCSHEVDATLGILWRFLQVATGEPVPLTAVHLVHQPLTGTREHRRILGAPIFVGSRHNGLFFDARALGRPLVSADGALARVMGRHLEAILQSLPDDGIVERVRRDIGEALTKRRAQPPRVGQATRHERQDVAALAGRGRRNVRATGRQRARGARGALPRRPPAVARRRRVLARICGCRSLS